MQRHRRGARAAGAAPSSPPRSHGAFTSDPHTLAAWQSGAAGVAVYKLIKTRAVRERPYITHSVIQAASVPLDRYSFPSGHTLHAVSFTTMFAAYFPEWTAALAPAALLIALSRVILGLHYPTDVAAGALLGGLLGTVSIAIGGALAR